MEKPLMQILSENLGYTELVNGSWLATICAGEGIELNYNKPLFQQLAEYYEITETSNGSWIQAFAELGDNQTTINGTWLSTIIDNAG